MTFPTLETSTGSKYTGNSLEYQARTYADFILKNDVRTLAFFPKKKTSNAIANRARMLLLERLSTTDVCSTYFVNDRRYTQTLESDVKSQGYILHEVSLTDYDPRCYRDDIEQEVLRW